MAFDIWHLATALVGSVGTYLLKDQIEDGLAMVFRRKSSSETNGHSGEKPVSFWQKDMRDGYREVQNETIVPLLKDQGAELRGQTILLTEAVTYLKILATK